MTKTITLEEIQKTPVRILGISGSPRKGITDYLTQMALDEAAKIPGVEVEFLPLHKYRNQIHQCVQCEACLRLEEGHPLKHLCAAFDDGMEELIPKFLNADGYIIASPVYEMTYTPLLGRRVGELTRIVKYGRLLVGDPIIDPEHLDQFKGGKYNPDNIV